MRNWTRLLAQASAGQLASLLSPGLRGVTDMTKTAAKRRPMVDTTLDQLQRLAAKELARRVKASSGYQVAALLKMPRPTILKRIEHPETISIGELTQLAVFFDYRLAVSLV